MTVNAPRHIEDENETNDIDEHKENKDVNIVVTINDESEYT